MAGEFDFVRPGQIQGSGDTKALFLKLFQNEVLATFAQKVKTAGAHRIRQVGAGKSHQWPALGRAAAARFSVGDNILVTANNYLSKVASDEKVIYVDDPLIASTIIADFDEALKHFDTRQEYVAKLAESLSIVHDTSVLSTMVAAARASLTFSHSDYESDRVLNKGASGWDTAEEITAGLQEAAKIMDKNDVAEEGRICFVGIDVYHTLVNTYGAAAPSLLTTDVYGSLASLETGRLRTPVAGFEIRMTKNLPSTDKSANSTDVYGTSANDVFGANGFGYNGDFSTTKGICVTADAVGTVERWGLETQMEYKTEMQGELIVARKAEGHGILRPECAVELSSAV